MSFNNFCYIAVVFHWLSSVSLSFCRSEAKSCEFIFYKLDKQNYKMLKRILSLQLYRVDSYL